jgi:DNA repair photolyase
MKVDKKPKSVFGTREWAVENYNFINGCKHDCKYCYSKEMAIRFGRKEAKTWKIEQIRENDLKKNIKKKNGIIMYPSSHDITPEHLNESLIVLEKLLSAGNKVLIVTKPHYECVSKICKMFTKYKDKILFRFTISSSDSSILKFWEPGAPSFEERFKSLKYTYKLGFQTSVSCEPMLDFNIDKLIKLILPYITDSIWLGKANYLLKRVKTNGIIDTKSIKEATKLVEWQSNKGNIIDIYKKHKDNNKIKWKDSIKKTLKLERPDKKGLDI